MDRLKAMANFVRIVDSGSLSAAADVSGQSVASLVRSLAVLEKHLGVRLLNRSTRRMALTDEGEAYLTWSRRILAEFDDMEQRLEARDGNVRGQLRITAPVEFGYRYVAPLVNDFLHAHEALRIELNLNDQIIPLLDERIDLAVRIGHLPNSGLVARKVSSTRLVTCASPLYLERHPALAHPSALRDHFCISTPSQGRHWYFRAGEKEWAEEITPRLMCSQIRAAILACVEGVGIARVMHYQVAAELADGRLLRVLRPYEPENLPIQLVYPHSLQLAPRVRTFVDWACPQLEARTPDPDAD